jgi:hypothetical protein
MKYKSIMENKVADVFSYRVILLSVISVKVTGFERLKEEYESCQEFKEIYMTLRDESNHVIDGNYL